MSRPLTRPLTRRRFLRVGAVGSALALAGCDRLGADPGFRDRVLSIGETLAYRTRRLLDSPALAREYSESQLSPDFRTNGNTMPASADYRRLAETGFADWRLKVDGLVERPQSLALDELRAMPARTQITRHDCVEGWSAIGKWTGVPLAAVLERAGLRPEARFVVFHCADDFRGTGYYESIDLLEAVHPQTILAYGMNGADLPVGHGAPVRLRVERQLGYKQAKFVMRIEAVASLDTTGGGLGGYWEDAAGYEWYAGV